MPPNPEYWRYKLPKTALPEHYALYIAVTLPQNKSETYENITSAPKPMPNSAFVSFDSLIYYREYTLTEPPPAGTFVGKACINITMTSDTQNITFNLNHNFIEISERVIRDDRFVSTTTSTVANTTLMAQEVNIMNVTDDRMHQMVTLHLSSMMYVGDVAMLEIDFV